MAGPTGGFERNPVHPADRCALGGSAGTLPALSDLSSTLPGLGPLRCHAGRAGGTGRRPPEPRRIRSPRSLYRRDLRSRKKGGSGVGKTKRGKGTKIMAVADGAGLPIAVCAESATPHEVTLVQRTLAESIVAEPLQRLIGDNAYDSDRLDRELAETGVEMIAPHNRGRKRPHSGWPTAPALSSPLEDRTAVCLASTFSPLGRPMGALSGQLSRHGSSRLCPHPAAAFMRCVLRSNHFRSSLRPHCHSSLPFPLRPVVPFLDQA